MSARVKAYYNESALEAARVRKGPAENFVRNLRIVPKTESKLEEFDETPQNLPGGYPEVQLAMWALLPLAVLGHSAFVLHLGWRLLVACGLIALGEWLVLELTINYYLFDTRPRNKTLLRLRQLLRDQHHKVPFDPSKLLPPFVLELGVATAFYFLNWTTFGAAMSGCIVAVLLLVYLVCQCVHYIVHHVSLKSPIGRRLRQSHMSGHLKSSHHGFGLVASLRAFTETRNHEDSDFEL